MRGDLARMNKIIPASEKDRLAAHAVAIQSLEASLRQSYGGASTSPQCTTPTVPPNYSTVGETGNGKDRRDFQRLEQPEWRGLLPRAGQLHARRREQLLRASRRCDEPAADDQSRVRLRLRARRHLHVLGGHQLGRVPVDVWRRDDQPGRLGQQRQSTPHHPPSHTDDAPTHGWLNQINKFYSQMTADALKEFATTPDVDGNMLLDNTIVVYVTEVARAWDHNQQNMPLIVFGGKNTGLKGGTYLKVTGGHLAGQTGGSSNRPFNDMWLALAPKFGVTLPSLGASTQWTGPLSGLFG